MPLLIEHLAAAGLLRTGLTGQEAADTVWAVNSEVYQLMTETRGWTAPQYQRWLADTLIRLLLAADGLPIPVPPR
ncbi:MAG TPA: hypothetical protein VIX15_11190 [Streptosporangiaceae bacterium]